MWWRSRAPPYFSLRREGEGQAHHPQRRHLCRQGDRRRSLAKKGEDGYVVSIGTFLQQFYIYGVEFLESGNRVGMKRKELDPVIARDEMADLPLPEERHA